MKTFILLTLLSFSAMAAEFECSISQNLSEIYRSDVTVNGKDVQIAAFEEYEFFISHLGDGKYELQSYNRMEPSRSYAETRISASNPEIGLTIWKREAIIEVHCALKAN